MGTLMNKTLLNKLDNLDNYTLNEKQSSNEHGRASIIDSEDTGGHSLVYIGTVDDYFFACGADGPYAIEFFDIGLKANSYQEFEDNYEERYNRSHEMVDPNLFPAIGEALKSYASNMGLYRSSCEHTAELFIEYNVDDELEESHKTNLKEQYGCRDRDDLDEIAEQVYELIGSDNTDYIKEMLDAIYEVIVRVVTDPDYLEFVNIGSKNESSKLTEGASGTPLDRIEELASYLNFFIKYMRENNVENVKLDGSHLAGDCLAVAGQGYLPLNEDFDETYYNDEYMREYIAESSELEEDVQVKDTDPDTMKARCEAVVEVFEYSARTFKDYKRALNMISKLEYDNDITRDVYDIYIKKLQDMYAEGRGRHE